MAIHKKLLLLLSISLLSCSDSSKKSGNGDVVINDEGEVVEYIDWYPNSLTALNVGTNSLDGQWLIVENTRKSWDRACNSSPNSDRCTGFSEATELHIVNINEDAGVVSVQGCYEENFSQHTLNVNSLEIIRSENAFYSALIGDTSIVDNNFNIGVTNNRYMQATFSSGLYSDLYIGPLQGFEENVTNLEGYKLTDIPLTTVGTISIGGAIRDISPLCLQIDEGETRLIVDAGEYSLTLQTIEIGGEQDFFTNHFKDINSNGEMIISTLDQSASGGASYAAYYNDIYNAGGEAVVAEGSATVELNHLLLNGLFDGSFSITDKFSNNTINGTYSIDLSVYRP